MIDKFIHVCFKSRIAWILLTVVAAAIASNLTIGDELQSEVSSQNKEKILREGTPIENRACQCGTDGERLSVTMEGTPARTWLVLENLASQRILQAVLEEPSDKHWIVSGSLTEFRGRNFLLLERASRVSR